MARRTQGLENIDKSENLKVEGPLPAPFATWESELANRIAAVMEYLGRDISVQVSEKSWKQLQRYAKGDEPPLAVVRGLADAAHLSLGYLIDGIIQVSADAEMERVVGRRCLDAIEEGARAEPGELSDADLSLVRDTFQERDQMLTRLSAKLLNRKRYPRSYADMLEGKDPYYSEDINPKAVREIQEYVGVANTQEPLESAGFVMIPRYDVEASAGNGAFANGEHIVDYMAFKEEFVRRTLRVAPDMLVLITAVGDSMMPTINPGDLLLIDRSVDRIIDDAIYVLVKRGELVVKRVQQFFDGAVTIKSDNGAYVEETLTAKDAEDVQVAGRVRWIGRLI